MSSFTKLLKLLKKDPVADANDTFNIETMLNENWEKIDEAFGQTYHPDNKPTPEDIGAITTYTSIKQLGLSTSTVTMNAIFVNMKVGSQLIVYGASGWPSEVLPTINGTLFVQKIHEARITAWFFNTLTNTRVYFGTATTGNTFGGWHEFATTDYAVPLNGSKAMTNGLNFQTVDNGYGRILKSHSDTTDYGTFLRDYAKDGTYVSLAVSASTNTASFVDKNSQTYSILHTGNVPSPGNFILGSYVGTGTVGAEGKCSITFPFAPKYVVISTAIGGTATAFTFINPDTTFAVNKDTFGTFLNFHCTWSDKTLTWWISGNSDAAGDQLNREGTTYEYVAWG